MRLFRYTSCLVVLFGLSVCAAQLNAQQDSLSPDQLRAFEQSSPQWPDIQAHLPDPSIAAAEQLETAADVLRARRFPQSALDYYMYAMRSGGNEVRLLNKMGITELGLGHMERARAYFKQVIKLKKKDAEGWNNLGAVEYVMGEESNAIFDYKHAIKLDKKGASYHSNLATAYLEEKNWSGARKEYAIALRLDPGIFERSSVTGITARMLTTDDHARFCYELARLFAEQKDEDEMLHYLTMASEGGFDVLEAMSHDQVMDRYRKDPRVLLLVHNARALREGRASVENVSGGISPLPPGPQVQHE